MVRCCLCKAEPPREIIERYFWLWQHLRGEHLLTKIAVSDITTAYLKGNLDEIVVRHATEAVFRDDDTKLFRVDYAVLDRTSMGFLMVRLGFHDEEGNVHQSQYVLGRAADPDAVEAATWHRPSALAFLGILRAAFMLSDISISHLEELLRNIVGRVFRGRVTYGTLRAGFPK